MKLLSAFSLLGFKISVWHFCNQSDTMFCKKHVILLYLAAQHKKRNLTVTCHPSLRLSSLLEPPDKDLGIRYTSLFRWSKVTNGSWLLTLFKILPPQFPSFCISYTLKDRNRLTGSWTYSVTGRRKSLESLGCNHGGWLAADGAWKRLFYHGNQSGLDHWMRYFPFFHFLVSRLQLVSLTTVFLFQAQISLSIPLF